MLVYSLKEFRRNVGGKKKRKENHNPIFKKKKLQELQY